MVCDEALLKAYQAVVVDPTPLQVVMVNISTYRNDAKDFLAENSIDRAKNNIISVNGPQAVSIVRWKRILREHWPTCTIVRRIGVSGY